MEENIHARMVHTDMCLKLVRIAKADGMRGKDMREVPEFMKILNATETLEDLYPTLKEHCV
mgnify:CR=1 FL=1|tara:strand:- start:14114 stop:14296 length:183 start_codon:yes stop_codon:yes gene_type:complete